jgi:DNA-binding MarR family transcriptional regulator
MAGLPARALPGSVGARPLRATGGSARSPGPRPNPRPGTNPGPPAVPSPLIEQRCYNFGVEAEPLVLGLGTRLRHVLELLDGDVAQVYADLGMSDYRPRFSPVVRALVQLGPSSIRDLARAIGVTHSAASQTVAQMTKCGLVVLEPGADARQRIVRLTGLARSLLPVIDAEWAATGAAVEEMDAELPVPLAEMLAAILRAVERRPLRQRIGDAARALGDPALAPLTAR